MTDLLRPPAFLILALVVGAAWPASASAGEATAEGHYEEGMRHYKRGEYLKAARSYVLAFDLAGAPELAYNAARAFDQGGRWRDARRYYDRWLDGAPPLGERERLAERLAKGSKKAARQKKLDLAAARLHFARELLVTPDPDLTYRLARVLERSDRRQEAADIYRLALDEGHGDPDAIEAALARLDSGPAAGGLVLVGDAENIRVRIDGEAFPGAVTGQEIELPPGEHKVIVDQDGHRPWRGIVVIRPGQVTKAPIQLAPIAKPSMPAPMTAPARPGRPAADRAPFSWPPPTYAWLAGGGALALASAGLICGSLAAGAEDDLDACVLGDDKNCATSKVPGQLSERAQSWELRANVAYVGAFAALGAGAWLWFSEPVESGPEGEDELEGLDDEVSAWIVGVGSGGMAGFGGRF